jgi:hypothetical protein
MILMEDGNLCHVGAVLVGNLTANGWFLVLLEIIVDKAKDK